MFIKTCCERKQTQEDIAYWRALGDPGELSHWAQLEKKGKGGAHSNKDTDLNSGTNFLLMDSLEIALPHQRVESVVCSNSLRNPVNSSSM